MLAIKFFAYPDQNNMDLQFPLAYSEFTNACMTLFQMLTNDHWVRLLSEQGQTVALYWFSAMFSVSWLLLASYILKNLLIGVLVDSLVSMRSERELLEQEEKKRLEDFVFGEVNSTTTIVLPENIAQDESTVRLSESTIHLLSETEQTSRQSPMMPESLGENSGVRSFSHTASPTIDSAAMEHRLTFRGIEDMHARTERNLQHVVKREEQLMWPRDTLLLYFIMMEQLQENLLERQRLILLCKNALLLATDI